MKILMLIFITSNIFAVGTGPDIPFVGRNKAGNRIVKEKGKCFKIIAEEYLVHVSCKDVVKK